MCTYLALLRKESPRKYFSFVDKMFDTLASFHMNIWQSIHPILYPLVSLVNNRWRDSGHVNGKERIRCPERELLAVGLTSYYLLREFLQAITVAVYLNSTTSVHATFYLFSLLCLQGATVKKQFPCEDKWSILIDWLIDWLIDRLHVFGLWVKLENLGRTWLVRTEKIEHQTFLRPISVIITSFKLQTSRHDIPPCCLLIFLS